MNRPVGSVVPGLSTTSPNRIPPPPHSPLTAVSAGLTADANDAPILYRRTSASTLSTSTSTDDDTVNDITSDQAATIERLEQVQQEAITERAILEEKLTKAVEEVDALRKVSLSFVFSIFVFVFCFFYHPFVPNVGY